MSRLAPSHPVARYGPSWLREKIDVMGCHLIWQGCMSRQRNHAHATHTETTNDDKKHLSVSRVVWSLMTGEDLPDELVLWRIPACIHDRCCAPGCFEKITKPEASLRMNLIQLGMDL